jgi:hypothetical protein
MAKASELLTLDCAFFVGQQRPLASLAKWKRWLIRATFWLTGWAGGIEGQSICTDEDLARKMCDGKPNWFIQPLPINVSLPDETCQFQGHYFPASDSPYRYRHLNVVFEAVPKGLRERELEGAQRLEAKLDELDERRARSA